MPSVYTNTAHNVTYGVKASNGTMGILCNGRDVLIIHRRLKTSSISENGPPDSWSFAGGGLEPDETPEQCIVREMREELGVDVAIRVIGDEPIMEPHKHVGLKWIAWEDLWKEILVDIGSDGEIEERDQGKMRFFPSMKNMVLKYPKRNDPACLAGR
ncbi:Hypothetical protein D9617_45g091320 [Elsinoe fawcettii]|nr:Hypothetical protein D9617_45g091320 [Elsinoe fawcettii]